MVLLPRCPVGGVSGRHSPDGHDPSGRVCAPVTASFLLQELSAMLHTDRPDWQSVMQYVAQIYKYFET